jgi:hypothetical protein
VPISTKDVGFLLNLITQWEHFKLSWIVIVCYIVTMDNLTHAIRFVIAKTPCEFFAGFLKSLLSSFSHVSVKVY